MNIKVNPKKENWMRKSILGRNDPHHTGAENLNHEFCMVTWQLAVCPHYHSGSENYKILYSAWNAYIINSLTKHLSNLVCAGHHLSSRYAKLIKKKKKSLACSLWGRNIWKYLGNNYMLDGQGRRDKGRSKRGIRCPRKDVAEGWVEKSQKRRKRHQVERKHVQRKRGMTEHEGL